MEDKRFAILIDADNISSKYIPFILEEIANYGVATYKRIYGDWTKPESSSWKDVLLSNSITPIQQYSYTLGKNATDSAMIIDAMDILYSGNVDGFCIASSDSDFTKLSSRLRESAMFVIGMGERKTPKPFIASCNQFKYLDVLAEAAKVAAKEDSKEEEKANPKAATTKKPRTTAKSKATETKTAESKSSENK
ncbi:MAG: NYN domain-containing protein, partial [Vallitaleaceae bacterium]|nr:NYN domain-containing protein [Vallitaleaceae bacterium]